MLKRRTERLLLVSVYPSILLVIQILDSVYEPIYTVNNFYNDFLILQDIFLRENKFTFYKWNLVLFTSYSNIP